MDLSPAIPSVLPKAANDRDPRPAPYGVQTSVRVYEGRVDCKLVEAPKVSFRWAQLPTG
jgi:hypothetical protein